MLAPPISISHVLRAENSESTLRIPIQVCVFDKTISASALIDSGAEGQFISSKFVIRNRIPTHKLSKPIPVLNVDGSPNANGMITHYTVRLLKVGRRQCPTLFYVTSIGKEDIILGLPWLKKYNPNIDWKKQTINIRKTTTATSLAQQKQQIKGQPSELVPATYHNYLSLFEKGAASRLPEHRPYDHAINLKPEFIPKDCKVYSMSPQELQALNEFLTENLEKRYIRPSKSPMASPFFFVDKKDNTL